MSDNFDLKKYLIENKATTNSRMLNEDWTEPEGGLIDSAAKSFPQLVKKYGLEAVKVAFDIIYENTYGYAIENRADEEEAEKYAEEEILEKVEYFKKDPTDLENLIIDTLADMEADSDMTETKKKHSKMNESSEDFIKSIVDQFPEAVEEYGFENVESAFEQMYENAWENARAGFMYPGRADTEEATDYATKEVLKTVKFFKKTPGELESYIEEMIEMRG